MHLRLFAHYILYKIPFSPQTLLAIDFHPLENVQTFSFPWNLKEKETQ